MKKVFVFGGTHGNEWTGVQVVTKYAAYFRQKFQDLDLHFVLCNPEAYKLNRRFKDEDLNRAFQFLHEDRPHSFEHQRAKELKAMVNEEPCFVIDLHTTTSNMGQTIILCHENHLNLSVARDLTARHSDCRAILSPDPKKKYLASQSDFGMMIEVGPVPNGLVDGKILEQTLSLLEGILSALSTPNSSAKRELVVFEEIQDVAYPKNEKNDISAYIHAKFQGKDFSPVRGRYVPFRSYEGKEITLETAEELYPIFINEAAYYPQQLAFTLCRKRILNF